jgi:hypothetical protein
MRSTPVFSIVPHGDSAKSSALQVPSFHPFPHVNVTCLFTNPHALWGLVRVNSTPPIQELGFRHKAFPLSIDSRLARLELPNTPPHAAAFLHCFSYHFTPYCISRIGVYVHRPSEIPPLRITSGSFLQNAEWPSLTRLLPCFPIQTFLQLISQFKPVLPGGLFTPDPLTSGFQALTASKSQQADHFQLSPQPNQQLYTSTSRAAWGPKFQRSHSGRIPACAS